MSTWKVARVGRTCALSGRPLPPDTPVLAALFGEAEEVSEDKVRGTGLVRKDYLVDEVPAADLARAVEGAYCTWRTRTKRRWRSSVSYTTRASTMRRPNCTACWCKR